MKNINEYISFTEYAKLHGVSASAVRRKALRGNLKTAQKIGRNWVIHRDEPYTDHRIVSGNYIGARRNAGASKNKE